MQRQPVVTRQAAARRAWRELRVGGPQGTRWDGRWLRLRTRRGAPSSSTPSSSMPSSSMPSSSTRGEAEARRLGRGLTARRRRVPIGAQGSPTVGICSRRPTPEPDKAHAGVLGRRALALVGRRSRALPSQRPVSRSVPGRTKRRSSNRTRRRSSGRTEAWTGLATGGWSGTSGREWRGQTICSARRDGAPPAGRGGGEHMRKRGLAPFNPRRRERAAVARTRPPSFPSRRVLAPKPWL